jgi:phospholipase C
LHWYDRDAPQPVSAHGDIQNARYGYGPRISLLAISPYAKKNYVDHRVVDQSSILRFIEDNWNLSRMGNGSTDAVAGSLFGMFDFDDHHDRDDFNRSKLILDPVTGLVVSDHDDR